MSDAKNKKDDKIVLLRMEREKCNSGELHASLIWNDIADLDLHVITPSGEHMYFAHKESRCGGWLDRDMNAGGEASKEPIENIFWASSPSGRYRIYVNNYSNKTDPNTVFTDPKRKVPFRVRLKRNNKVEWFDGAVGPSENQTCFEFDHEGSGALGSFVVLPAYNEPKTFAEICTDNNVVYKHGSGYYCLMKKESISEKKDMLLHDTEKDTFIIGLLECRRKLGKPDTGKIDVTKKDVPNGFKLYVQSTSNNRKIPKNTKTLMSVSVRDAIRFRRSDDYKL